MNNKFSAEEKGVLIESIVANIFLASGLKIFQNGAEIKHHDFYTRFMEMKKNGLEGKYDPRLRQLLSIPDFIIENLLVGPRVLKYDFAEVKFRSIHHLQRNVGDELIHKIDLIRHFQQARKFWKPEIILVTSEPLETTGMFSVISDPYYEYRDGKLALHIKKLTEIERWGISPVVVESFEKIVTQMLVSTSS